MVGTTALDAASTSLRAAARRGYSKVSRTSGLLLTGWIYSGAAVVRNVDGVR